MRPRIRSTSRGAIRKQPRAQRGVEEPRCQEGKGAAVMDPEATTAISFTKRAFSPLKSDADVTEEPGLASSASTRTTETRSIPLATETIHPARAGVLIRSL